jgi:hypothetical protein
MICLIYVIWHLNHTSKLEIRKIQGFILILIFIRKGVYEDIYSHAHLIGV